MGHCVPINLLLLVRTTFTKDVSHRVRALYQEHYERQRRILNVE